MSKTAHPGSDDARRRALWLRLWAELGAAPIVEAYLTAPGETVHGVCIDGDAVVINPVPATVDTILHELLHRVYPDRSERSIRRTTTQLRKFLPDDEVQLFYAEYCRRRKKGRSRRADV